MILKFGIHRNKIKLPAENVRFWDIQNKLTNTTLVGVRVATQLLKSQRLLLRSRLVLTNFGTIACRHANRSSIFQDEKLFVRHVASVLAPST